VADRTGGHTPAPGLHQIGTKKRLMALDDRKELIEEERRAIFLALVEAQDGDANVVKSRKDILHRFAISDRELRRIEQEGIDGEWPPLGP